LCLPKVRQDAPAGVIHSVEALLFTMCRDMKMTLRIRVKQKNIRSKSGLKGLFS